MRLRVHTVVDGRFYLAGSEIEDARMPAVFRGYAVATGEEKHEPAPSDATAKPRAARGPQKSSKG